MYMQCVPCIYTIHILYLKGTYIVFKWYVHCIYILRRDIKADSIVKYAVNDDAELTLTYFTPRSN